MKKILTSIALALMASAYNCNAQTLSPEGENPMTWGDTSRTGTPFSKDPHVVRFHDSYLMYYSIPPGSKPGEEGWAIGISRSTDLENWEKIAEILPAEGCEYEKNGLCAPGAIVRNDTIHLFYQTYGNGPKDAICHAWSTDGINFKRNATNPIFHPTGDWNCGRAIDAEVIEYNGKYFLYYASRTPDYRVQILGVATAPSGTDFSRNQWTQACDASILFPQLDWEGECIEAPTATVHNGVLYLAYAGAYNNCPQQIGLAASTDGINFKRLTTTPFLPVGAPDSWNSSESGHPHLFHDPVTDNTYLFFQGNNTHGQNWVISRRQLIWD